MEQLISETPLDFQQIANEEHRWSPIESGSEYPQPSTMSKISHVLQASSLYSFGNPFELLQDTPCWGPFKMETLDELHENYLNSPPPKRAPSSPTSVQFATTDPEVLSPSFNVSPVSDRPFSVSDGDNDSVIGFDLLSPASLSDSAFSENSSSKRSWATVSPRHREAPARPRRSTRSPLQGARNMFQDQIYYERSYKERRTSTSTSSTSPKISSGKLPQTRTFRGRLNHNLTEKRYRTRLNGQFETLLSVLPTDLVKSCDPSLGGAEQPGRKASRVSKAEVLILAKEHIQALERKRKALEGQRQALKDNVKHLKALWVEAGEEKAYST